MKPNAADPPRRPGFFGIALYVVLMGALLSWAAFFAMPAVIGWEMPQPLVDRIPAAGFLVGALLGLAMGFSERIRQFVWFAIGTIVTGFLLWLFLVACAELGVTLILDDEAFEQTMEQISTAVSWLVAFAVAIVIAIGAFAFIQDKAAAMLERFRPKPPKTR